MGVYKRGGKYYYKFRFRGQIVREAAHTHSRDIAERAEKKRKYEIEFAANGLKRVNPPSLFRAAAQAWLAEKKDTRPKTILGYQQRLVPVLKAFGDRLLCDISREDVRDYRSRRINEGMSNRTANYEVCVIRGVLRSKNLWANLFPNGLEDLEENENAGRVVSDEHESASPALLPLFLLAIDTGLREYREQSVLQMRDLSLNWKDGVIVSGHLIVPESKTEAGKGRMIPLTQRTCAVLATWLSRLPTLRSENYIFPRYMVKTDGQSKQAIMYGVDLKRPMQSWYRSWNTAQRKAGLKVHYRWHDLRHSFVTRLLENPRISEHTVLALAGHVSKKMLERYSHIRQHAKYEAIKELEKDRGRNSTVLGGAQNWAQSEESKPS
jgi:integrase